MQRTIEQDLPEEAGFLKRYDAFRNELNLIVDMPERLSDLLFRFLHQNGGTLCRRARGREFTALTDEEAACCADLPTVNAYLKHLFLPKATAFYARLRKTEVHHRATKP